MRMEMAMTRVVTVDAMSSCGAMLAVCVAVDGGKSSREGDV